jgi:hypothetical protein
MQATGKSALANNQGPSTTSGAPTPDLNPIQARAGGPDVRPAGPTGQSVRKRSGGVHSLSEPSGGAANVASSRVPLPVADGGHNQLDEEQQHAFERIMAQIEEKKPDPKGPAARLPAPQAPVLGVNRASREEPAAPIMTSAEDLETVDISDEIDAILKEIHNSDAEADWPQPTEPEPVSQPEAPPPDPAPVQAQPIAVGVGGERSGPSDPGAAESAAGGDDGLPEDKQPDWKRTGAKNRPPAVTQPAPGRKRKALAALALLILGVAASLYLYRSYPAAMPDMPADAGGGVSEPFASAGPSTPAAMHTERQPESSAVQRAAERLARLRAQLIDRQQAFERLREDYQAGVEAEVQKIMARLRQGGNDGLTFQSAAADVRISLGLVAIQRRHTYISTLEMPIHNLARNSEELLYLLRKADLLALLAPKTADLDIDGFIRQADAVIEAHQSALAELDRHLEVAAPPDLESIWRRVETRLAAKPAAGAQPPLLLQGRDAVIAEEICRGDFSRTNQLTALSPQVARCLTAWSGKDLFLNALTDLSPQAARQLAAWEGTWLGLNGLRELTPETALYLAQWNGRRLSLNGLDRLSPPVVAIFSQWPGDQIELINLVHPVQLDNPDTRLFLSEDPNRQDRQLGK